jgi:hypothetical protein
VDSATAVSANEACFAQLIGGQAYSAHRDERLFPKAHIVDPERWVRQDTDGRWVARKDVTPEMQASYFPFGAFWPSVEFSMSPLTMRF